MNHKKSLCDNDTISGTKSIKQAPNDVINILFGEIVKWKKYANALRKTCEYLMGL